ncbi:N-acetylglucosamine-6-phosphate deacetylase [Polycladidibacter hongkongensis]|uniref:N-acetylglucosamine-6-phosphate deacetylase n=1 Tax=Polycladidibacter hongkongensis TaxID=1647556 RepID=UPI000833F326|nr:N-acetylglucosamine-6-phosphate deacetylase [Pseudovibrio hongkongensis]
MTAHPTTAFTGADIFTGHTTLSGQALLMQMGKITGFCPADQLPQNAKKIELQGGLLAPGFIDLQVNGGGGVLLNEAPCAEGLATICKAHAPLGTTALLPTLITDSPQVNAATRAAAREALANDTLGFLGLHLEGPHLSIAKRGAHAEELVRPMKEQDLQNLIALKQDLPVLMVTVAPENVSDEQIRRLSEAGIYVSLGHSTAGFARTSEALAAGARGVTHLFNAMTGLGHREPGMVGAALSNGAAWAGLIADGYHVQKEMLNLALRAKQGPAKIFLVTDAMSTIGTDMDHFTLNGRRINRADGRLTLENGTLAGADLDMISAVRFVINELGLSKEEALRMASLYPAQAIGLSATLGQFSEGADASILHLSYDMQINAVWIKGEQAA